MMAKKKVLSKKYKGINKDYEPIENNADDLLFMMDVNKSLSDYLESVGLSNRADKRKSKALNYFNRFGNIPSRKGEKVMVDAFSGADVPQYGIGGFLDDQGDNIMQTAMGIGLTAAGLPNVGLPMAISSGSDMLFGADEESQFNQPAVSKKSLPYQMPARFGMNLNKRPGRSDFKGNDHSQGGIPLNGLGVEVEDGEVRTGNTIHSKDLKITPAMIKRYKTTAGLKKGDKGKSVADVVKRNDKKFEKRAGDKWNDQARSLVQSGYEEMSNELADIYQIASEMAGQMGTAGDNLAAEGMDLSEFMNDSGNMPIIMSGIGAMTNALTPPEEVDYQGARTVPVTPTPIKGNYGQIRRVFGNTRGRLNRLNPRGFQNNAAALASAEAGAIGDMSSQVDNLNARNQNAADSLNAQQGSETSRFNAQLKAREAEANAANRGTRRSSVDAYLNNMGTQMGQKARDEKLYAMQERRMNMLENHLSELRKIRTGSPGNQSMNYEDIIDPVYAEDWMMDPLYEEYSPSAFSRETLIRRGKI